MKTSITAALEEVARKEKILKEWSLFFRGLHWLSVGAGFFVSLGGGF